MTQDEIIGRNIAHFRERLGFTQDQLAGYLGVARPMISYYENGERPIPSAVVSKLASLFGVEEIDLYEEDPSRAALHLAFAFRAGEMAVDDLRQVADFKKIVLNYLHMKKALGDASGHP